MTSIKIHWWNMVFHKRVAISVTLTAWTGGTATFSPASGTSYSLSSLPVGSKIVKASSTLYNITNSSNTVLWSITVTASSWYEISTVEVIRWWVKTTITSTPITLENWDSVWVTFEASTMRIYLNGNGYWTFKDGNNNTIQYADIPKVDSIRFRPVSSVGWNVEAYYQWTWTIFAWYQYSWWSTTKIKAVYSYWWDSGYVELYMDNWSTYNFPQFWSKVWWEYLSNSTFTMLAWTNYSLESYSDVWMQYPSSFTDDVPSYIWYILYWIGINLNNCQIREPNNWEFSYVFSDWTGNYCWMCDAMINFIDTQSGQPQPDDAEVIVAIYNYWWTWTKYVNMFVLNEWRGTLVNRWIKDWNDTWLAYFIPYTWLFLQWDSTSLNTWINLWQCSDAEDLMITVYNLATGK